MAEIDKEQVIALLEAIRKLPCVLGGLFSVMEFRVGNRTQAMEH